MRHFIKKEKAADVSLNQIFVEPASLCAAGVIAGAIIGAVLIISIIVGLLYYVFGVRGYRLSSLSLPTRTTRNVDVVSLRLARWV